jgi:hypothetical protein
MILPSSVAQSHPDRVAAEVSPTGETLCRTVRDCAGGRGAFRHAEKLAIVRRDSKPRPRERDRRRTHSAPPDVARACSPCGVVGWPARPSQAANCRGNFAASARLARLYYIVRARRPASQISRAAQIGGAFAMYSNWSSIKKYRSGATKATAYAPPAINRPPARASVAHGSDEPA